MGYLFVLFIAIVPPLLLGIRSRQKCSAWCVDHPMASALAAISLALSWLALVMLVRGYADSDAPGWRLAEWFAHAGKWYIFACAVLFGLGAITDLPHLGRARKTALVLLETIVIGLLVWRTMPVYFWLAHRCSRDSDRHMRQSIEYTCGPVCLGNLVETFCNRPSPTEKDLARLSGTTVEGTPMRGLIRAAKASGLEAAHCEVLSLHELRLCESGAIVQISTLPTVKHATLFLRVTGDKVELIDPAYGYRKVTVSRFLDIWYGKTLVLQEIGK